MEYPEPVERGKNFRLLTNAELPELLEFLAGYLPESLKFHQTVLTYLQNKVWDFFFYVSEGWPTIPVCLHFPGMTLSPHGLLYESFGVFCPTTNLDMLQLLRDENMLIDWDKPLYINFVHHAIADQLFSLYGETGRIERVLGDVWACEGSEIATSNLQMEDPESQLVQVRALRPEHAEGIHDLYPANDMECHELFLRLIRILPAAGVFVDGKLAAWMIQSYYGAMFSMQTKPEYRRKGYGTKLARYLTNAVVEKGYTPFVVIRPENEASQSLYKKLGFRKLYQTVRATFTPYICQEYLVELESNIENNDYSNCLMQDIDPLQSENDPNGQIEKKTICHPNNEGAEEQRHSKSHYQPIDERISLRDSEHYEENAGATRITDCLDTNSDD